MNSKYLTLAGRGEKNILNLSDPLLLYLLSILKGNLPDPFKVERGEWNLLLNALAIHRLVPLFYQKVMKLPVELHPPEDTKDKLRMIFLQNRLRVLSIEKQLKEIVNIFKKDDIKYILLKGFGMGITIYSDPVFRIGDDIDLLVLRDDVVKAESALESLGYKCNDKIFKAVSGFHMEEKYIRKKSVNVDLHWDIHILYGMRTGEFITDLYERACEVHEGSLTFKVLHPVDNLVYCSIHIDKHPDEIRLIWIYDLSLIAKELSNKDDWEEVRERAIQWQAVMVLKRALVLAQTWTDIKIPEGFLVSLKKERSIKDRIYGYKLFNSFKKSFLTERVSINNIQYLLKTIFPEPSRMYRDFPPSHRMLLPLSYIRRWLKWIMK